MYMCRLKGGPVQVDQVCVCVFTPGYVLNSVSCQHRQVLDELRHDRGMEEDETGNIRGVKN